MSLAPSSDDDWMVIGDVDNAPKLRTATLDVLHGADSVAAAREAAEAAERETHMVALARGRLLADMCRGQAPDDAVEAARASGGHAAALQLLHEPATWAKIEAQFARDAPRQELIVCGTACATGDDYKAAVRRALDVAASVAGAGSGVVPTTAPLPAAPPAPGYVASAGWYAVRLLTLGWFGATTTTAAGGADGPQAPAPMTAEEREGAYRVAVALAQQQSLVPLYEGVRAQFDATAGGALLIAEVSPLDDLPAGASRRAVIHVRETVAGSGRFVVEIHKWLRVLRPNSLTARNGHTLLLVRAVLTCPLNQADPVAAANVKYDADAFLEWRLEVPLSDAAAGSAGSLAAAAASSASSATATPPATSAAVPPSTAAVVPPASNPVVSASAAAAATQAAPAPAPAAPAPAAPTASSTVPPASTGTSVAISRAPATASRLPFRGAFPFNNVFAATAAPSEAQQLIENALRRAREVAEADAALARRLAAGTPAASTSAGSSSNRADAPAASAAAPLPPATATTTTATTGSTRQAGGFFGAPAMSINVFAPTAEQIAAQREIEASLARANAAVDADEAFARALAAASSVTNYGFGASAQPATGGLAAAAAAAADADADDDDVDAVDVRGAPPALAVGPVSASFFPAFGAEATPSQLRLQAEIEEDIRRSIEQDKADREAARRLFEELNGASPSAPASTGAAGASAGAAAAANDDRNGRFGPSLLLEALQRTATGARAALEAASSSSSAGRAAGSNAVPLRDIAAPSSGAPPPPRPVAMGGALAAAAPAVAAGAAPQSTGSAGSSGCSCLGASAGHHRPTCPLRR